MGQSWGQVRRYDSAKGYGFISGDDGLDYFFHVTSVTDGARITEGQRVTFEPGTSTKGPRAGRVAVQGPPPPPDRFIMVRDLEVRGREIVEVIAEDFWYEAYDPNEAKDGLRDQAIDWGANAIVGLHLEKYSKSPYPFWGRLIGIAPNYFQTMHRFYGKAVIIQ